MAKGIPSFHGSRLVQAREARGLYASSLATIVGVKPPTISQYESDTVKPPFEMLQKFASALNVPQSFFLRATLQYHTPRFFYRSLSAATKAARKRAESRFEWLREITHYFESYFDLPTINLPKLDVPKSFVQISDEMIEAFAMQTRQHWGLREGPIPNLVRIMEKNGVVVGRCLLDADTLDAFSEADTAGRPIIILGSDKNICVRSRFDAAHELAHCLIHRNVDNKSINRTTDYPLLEKQAHLFASAFLMPAAQFTQELIAPTLESFRALKERWKVSISAMLMRCQGLKLLTERQAENAWINVGRRGWKTQEPFDDTLSVEQPRLLRQCVDMIVDARVKSRSQIAEDLCLSQQDIEELAGLPNGYLSEGFGEVIVMPQIKSPSANTGGDKDNVVSVKFG